MKKLFIFAFAITAISLGSCKKDRTCECTYTNTNSGSSSNITKSTITIKKIKKSEAKNICQKTTYTSTNSSGLYTSTGDCKLK